RLSAREPSMLKSSHFVAIAIVCAALTACSGKNEQTATGDNAPVATINDKTPAFKRDSQWAIDGLKAAAMAQQVMSRVQPPSAEAINKFIAENPRAFA